MERDVTKIKMGNFTGLTTCVGINVVDAEPMNKGVFNESQGWPALEEYFKEAGYKVIYDDGYISWCPKEIFESRYRTIFDMAYPMALHMAMLGFGIARNGWNGKGMYVVYIPGTVTLNPHLEIKNVDGTFSTWVPSINDNLADDWILVTDIK